MNTTKKRRLAPIGVLLLMMWILFLTGSASAQAPEPWVLFGHEISDEFDGAIVTIATDSGLARMIGPMGFSATHGSALEACRAPVKVQGGITYPAETIFGVIRDTTFDKDYLVVIDNEAGTAVKSVELDLAVSGRGIAFGPDGSTLYAYKPPGELWTIDTVTGALSLVGPVVDNQGVQYSGVSLQWDEESGQFIGLGSRGWNTVLRIDPGKAVAEMIGVIQGMNACTITRAPAPVEGPGGSTWPEGTWFVVNNNTEMLHALQIDTVAGVIKSNEEVGPLGVNASRVCGSAFAREEAPWASPTMPGYPGYPGPTSTEPTSGQMTATPTWTPVSGASATPPGPETPSSETATPTVPSGEPWCVCPIVQKRVPSVVIEDALANPSRYYGWRYPLDLGKPAGPGNPLRECLSLTNVGIDYHPLWNKPVWRVGCQ